MLFAKRDTLHGSPSDTLKVLRWSGKLPRRDVVWNEAKEHLRSERSKARAIYLGTRCALSTEAGAPEATKPSRYQNLFKQGATIVPRSFYFVRLKEPKMALSPRRSTGPKPIPTAQEAKPPYQDVRMSGIVEGRFIYCTALSKHLLPFVALDPPTIVLPVETKGDALHLRSVPELTRDGFRAMARWLKEAERIWTNRRGEKAGKQTVLERLDYQGELTRQSLAGRHLVLYNAAGTNVSASYFDRQAHPLPYVAEHKLYWSAFADEEEAYYLTAFLNSQVANELIKPFQSTGLLGERDIEKKLLDFPFPFTTATYRDTEPSLKWAGKALLSGENSRWSRSSRRCLAGTPTKFYANEPLRPSRRH